MTMQSMLLLLLSHSKQHALTETAVVVLNVAGNAIDFVTNSKYELSTLKDNKFKASSNGLSTHNFPITLRFKI